MNNAYPGPCPDGGNLVRRGLSVVLHRQAALRGGAGALRAPRRGRRSCGALRARPRGAARRREGTAAERLAAKYGMSLERAQQLHAEMTERAAAEGLEFRFDLARGGNTFDAHRLIHWPRPTATRRAKERLMRAYFTEGEPIGDPETLVRLVAEVGVDPDEARDVARRPTASPTTCARTSAGPAARHPGRAVLRARPPLRRLRRAAARGARPGARASLG